MSALIRIAESGVLPDSVIRLGIRRLLRERLREQERIHAEGDPRDAAAPFDREPLAVETDRANEQHYELPEEFFGLMLGPHRKYSACVWSSPECSLEQAEAETLQLTCDRAELEDGMTLLDLGCGWGSLSLWVAQRYPRCRVTAVSNSRPQAQFIAGRAAQRKLSNLRVLTEDVNRFQAPARFDRIISVEMFEHMRNYRTLLARMAGWMNDDGKALVHLFCHRRYAYFYEIDDDGDWMARYFFTGGTMPSLDLLKNFDQDLCVARQWTIDGTHYGRTLNAWLDNLDRRAPEARTILGRHYGATRSRVWLVRWRLFLLACAELFRYGGGREWMVAHYLMDKTSEARSAR